MRCSDASKDERKSRGYGRLDGTGSGPRHESEALRGRDTLLVPWVQDFSFSVPYGIDEVRAQIDAARLSGAKGYMLWNAEGLYTDGALEP